MKGAFPKAKLPHFEPITMPSPTVGVTSPQPHAVAGDWLVPPPASVFPLFLMSASPPATKAVQAPENTLMSRLVKPQFVC